MGELSERSAGKLASKLPSWAAAAGKLVVPSAVNLEQCSSEAAARFKASIAARIAGTALPAATEEDASGAAPASERGGPGSGRPKAIADLTGGLGADTFAFAGLFERVLHNDADASLSAAVQQNFALLGVSNVVFSCHDTAPGELAFVRSFAPDIIYLDPARRDGAGRKVFLLEQCSPDLLSLEDELLGICPDVLVKLSPMADISMLRERLGGSFRALWIVSLGGECKELLCHLHRGAAGLESITLVSLPGAASHVSGPQPDASSPAPEPLPGAASLAFGAMDQGKRAPVWDEGASSLCGRIIFEPGAALSKSGCADALALRFGMSKLSRNTHLFVLPSALSGPGAGCPVDFSLSAEAGDLDTFGKSFLVKEVLPFGKAAFREVRQRFPRADVSAHNIPLGSENLCGRLGVHPGGEGHIFGVAVGPSAERALLVTRRL